VRHSWRCVGALSYESITESTLHLIIWLPNRTGRDHLAFFSLPPFPSAPMPTTTQPPKPKRRWYQFSLKTLLVVMFVSCIVFAWIGWRMQRARENRARVAAFQKEFQNALTEIRKLGGRADRITYDMRQTQTWLEKQFDDPGDADPHVVLSVYHVDLSESRVTDAGLEYLKWLTELSQLELQGTSITDAGLEHLNGLTSLHSLDLSGTKVTDEGVKKLQQALPRCRIRR